MSSPSTARRMSRIRVGRGALDTEERLFGDLRGALAAGAESLARPLLVVVPSRSLRLHFLAACARRFDAAVLGLRCTTLWGVAREVASRHGGPVPPPVDLFPAVAKRLARREPALQRALDGLRDGYSALLGSVRDLLDAGLEEPIVEALEEALREEGNAVASRRELERTVALLRVAAGTSAELAAIGGRRSHVLAFAAGRIRQGDAIDPEPRQLFIHGFSDATGLATDLLEALLNRYPTTLYLDQPPDPAQPDEPDASHVFSRRFRERLQLSAALEPPGPPGRPATEPPRLFRALGGEAEIRELARRILALLASGQPAEGIGVVARQLAPYHSSLCRAFGELGIPFSGVGARRPRGRSGRTIKALVDLVGLGARCPLDRWLEAAARGALPVSRPRLRNALFTLGLGRLGQLAGLKEHADVRLPVPRGFVHRDERGSSLHRLRVPATAIGDAARLARRTLEAVESWRRAPTVGEQRRILHALAAETLAWRTRPDLVVLAQRLDELLAAAPATAEMVPEDAVELLDRHLAEVDAAPLGGEGGGVQVLDIVEARSRTFDHLFVLGCNRSVFPRVVREDPLLPDRIRGVLARQGHGVLPDLADKRAGFDEERHLFAQLLSASPDVTLSWQEVDDDNLPRTVSPLVERLRWRQGMKDSAGDAPLARELWSEPDDAPLLTAFEAAAITGMTSERSELEPLLSLALTEAGVPAPQARPLAAARLAILDEQGPDLRTPLGRETAARLGPYHGFLGPAAGGTDPRRWLRLFVTHLERIAACPWQFFLERVLGLEPAPDPGLALPGIEPRLIGSLVHDVLEAIVKESIPGELDSLTAAGLRPPVEVPWPEDTALQRLLRGRAEATVASEGIRVPGFARVLAEAARPRLDWARRLAWGDGRRPPAVLGAELLDLLELEDLRGERRRIGFRADRVDHTAGGYLLTDYKTGSHPVSTAKRADTRRKHLLRQVGQGRLLQAVAYARASRPERDRGRYLFLHPELSDDRGVREVIVEGSDEEMLACFETAVRGVLASWDTGGLFPRLAEPDPPFAEPTRCKYCEVRPACVRGDSGARARLREWVGAHDASTPQPARDIALLLTWSLAAKGSQP